ncbi:MAG: fatty acid desaturase family protein [Proteobacteria bacterium]|nr:fatty acid desaturase family protein [Pseudomonadota bacterium]
MATWQIWKNPWSLPLLWVVIGSRQHAIAVVMHETLHQRLSPKWNASRTLGRLCAWPLFVSWSAFRANHLAHHKHLNTADDPDLQFKLRTAPRDWAFPKTSWQLFALLTKDLVGYGVVSNLRRLSRYSRGETPGQKNGDAAFADPTVLRIIFTLAFISLWVTALGWTSFLLLWIVPLFTTLPFMLRFRSIAEHFHLPDVLTAKTRNIRASWFEREVLGFGPHLIGYHVVHHQWPGIPFHSLKALDQQLSIQSDYEAGYMHIDGYIIGRRSLIRQLLEVRGAI